MIIPFSLNYRLKVFLTKNLLRDTAGDLSAVRTEFVNGHLIVLLTRTQDASGEVRLVGGVGSVLCLEADGRTAWEGAAALARIPGGPVVRVHLHGGFCRVNLHGTAAGRFVYLGSIAEFAKFLLVEEETVVIACAVTCLLIVRVNHVAYGMHLSEIERSAFHAAYFARGNTRLVNGDVEVGIDIALQTDSLLSEPPGKPGQ